MAKYDYDLTVIGVGTAGLVTSAGAASFGAKVALIEKDKLASHEASFATQDEIGAI